MIRSSIRRLLQKIGYDIVKFHPSFAIGKLDEEHLEKEYEWLRQYQFKTILDIGANEGQFAERIHTLFPQATIYSFEPLPEAFEKLAGNFSSNDNIIPINKGVGDKTGVIRFYRNEYSASSSFLELTPVHGKNFDYAIKTDTVEVEIDTLDNIMADKIINSPLLVKIDVQGYEDRVIIGGKKILNSADMIISEVSFKELYKDQMLFDGIYTQLKQLGFRYIGSIEQLRSPLSNEILQADAVFVR